MSISMLADIPATVSLTQQSLVYAGAFAALGFAAIGSAYGAGAASCSAVGAWKKCYAQNKPAPFQLVIFAGAPLSQTIYGMIVMFLILGTKTPEYGMAYLVVGALAGIAMGVSAAWQGVAAAGAADAFADTNKGFANQMMVLGVIETVAIFVMAFAIVLLGSFAPISNEMQKVAEPAVTIETTTVKVTPTANPSSQSEATTSAPAAEQTAPATEAVLPEK